MDWFLIKPLFVLSLSQVLLLFILSFYVFSIKEKTRGTWLLAIAISLLCITWFQQVLDRSLFVQLPFDTDSIDELTVPLTVFVLLSFAYTFLSNPFKAESRIVLTVTGSLVGINVLYQLYAILSFNDTPHLGVLCIELGNFLMLLMSLSVYVRKRAFFLKERPEIEDKGKKIKPLRAFIFLTLGMLLLSARGVWYVSTKIWQSMGTPSPFMEMINLPIFVVLFIGLVVIYVNYMPEPTSIQAKIAGLTLVTVVSVIGLLDPILFSGSKLESDSMSLLPNQQTLRFVPDERGGYKAGYVDFDFDRELGENLLLGPETEALVALDFSFPFYGDQWEEMYVDSNGLVSFGGPYLSRQFNDFYLDPLPKIAPFYRSLVSLVAKDSGVFCKRERDKVTVTWFLVWETLSGVPTNRNTVQLVLYEDGRIDFVYDRVEAPFNGYGDGLRGLKPGGTDLHIERVNLADLPAEMNTSGNLPAKRAIRFERDNQAGYQVAQIPFKLDLDLGSNLNLQDDSNARVPLSFSFPFYEAYWTELFISANGAVAFGSPINPQDSLFYRPQRDFFNESPKIAPFFVDLNPAHGGGVFHKTEPEKTTVTWDKVPLLGTSFVSTIQLVLHEGGAIDFVYDLPAVPLYGRDYWGIYAGDSRTRYHAGDYLYDFNAVHLAAASAIVDDFSLLYRKYIHAKFAPLALVLLLSTLFIVGVFPFFFRGSVIKPLDSLLKGVRQINEGNLSVHVPVRVNDEIGILANNFNRMTASLRNAEEQLRAYAVSLEDKVAERTADLEKALQHLTETQDQLIHAEKMASLGSLTAGIAHEIKNPLNFVNNFSELSIELVDELVEELKDPDQSIQQVLEAVESILPDLKRNSQKIQEHGQRADGIVRSMLDHSRSSADSRQVVDVNGLVYQYIDLAQRSDENAGIPIEIDCDNAIGEMELFPKEFGRVLTNLIKNALYAVQEKSQISNGKFEPSVKVTTQLNNRIVEIRVSDNGSGIAEDIQDRIFEPFFTTKPTGVGTGLGLSLSHDIVTRGHGGTLEMQSKEGWTEFVVKLPVA